MRAKVIIETFWNVNTGTATGFGADISYNRNILECKFGIGYFLSGVNRRYNRNILECKSKMEQII